MKKAFIAFLIASTFSGSIFAADQIAKEETTPPAAEGPLTIDQLQAYNSLPLANTPPPAANTTQAPNISSQPATSNEAPVQTQ